MLIHTLIYGAGMSLSFWGAYLLAVRLLHGLPAYVRIAGAFALYAWLLLAFFHVLAVASLFVRPVAYGVLVLFGVAMYLWAGRGSEVEATVQGDLNAARHVFRRVLGSRWAWLALPAIFMIVLVLLRGLVAPPLEWDALTYHLPKPARWVQAGGNASWAAPGATSYYQYFASGGDVFWAWAMLASHGDSLLAFASAWSVIASSALLYASARIVGASRSAAWLFVLCLMTMPAVFHYAASLYVDTLHISVLIFAILAMATALRQAEIRLAAVAGVALGVAAAIKITTLPYMAILGMAFMWYVFARLGSWNERRMWIGALLAGLLVCIPDYLHALVDTGSPFYPLEIDLGPLGVLRGNEEFTLLHTGSFWPDAPPMSAGMLLSYLFVFTRESWNHLNFGFAGAALVLAGAIALGIRGWQRQHRLVSATLLLIVAVGALMFASPSSGVYRLELWGPIVGRLLLLQAAAIILAGIALLGDRLRWVFGAAILVNIFQAIPAGLGDADLAALSLGWPYVLGAMVLLSGAVFVFVRKEWVRQSAVLVFSAMMVLAIPVDSVRTDLRYAYYKEAEKGIDGAFLAHPLEPHFVSAWPIWKYLDQDRPVRVAMTAGWDGYGQNWYWYPLFGSRLQNDVRYVPVTEEGDLIDYRRQDLYDFRASPEAWLSRLRDERIGYLAGILLAPEGAWARERPDVFERVVVSDDSLHALFRINETELERLIAEKETR